ncbi:cytosolic arginine sensor for mTORC1 subunit 2 isoform X2 [Gallus gallus]|uniref:GATS protein like 2 n=1 Tax=Gallus gallus TaxID=9031 RepID=A0A8V1ANF9_CHICK|nr:cytosolic arginine sensor for mTORC1 subunit 2 isoform X2 [Gallus gallus]XP_046785926.1 cytosolic arginine sensor for mTORC1 subunit 2 isoform X2 [Gallus gallus]|eukprot:XP_024997701.1 cytosolic arginine sensor for mTORC1 subunit 2 isoform X1 [Gallus gallus]
MELHILEHRLRVASIAKESIQLFTYGLIKLAFLSSKTRGRKTPSLCPLPRVHLSAWAFPSQTTGIANASSGAFPRLGDFVALFRTRNGDVNSAARTLLVFPAWCKFFSLTETPEDYTIIVDEEGFLELPSSEHLSVADATWLALNVVSGGGGFSGSQPIGVTKIAKSVIAPLADQNISVFMLSTYQTDFILVRDIRGAGRVACQQMALNGTSATLGRTSCLRSSRSTKVRERDLPFVMHTLAAEFTILRVVNGETVAADDLGITNGFVKPKLVQRPVIHPLSSPSNMFCVTSLDPDTLPTVATLLMDVMFYSNGVKDSVVGNEDSGHIRFFSFSLIEGYISLVMDVQTQQRFPNNLLFTSASGELWKMVRIGGQPLGFDECGIVAQISEPLAAADIPAYYISTFKFDHALVPEENINGVVNALQVSQAEKH